MACNRCSPFALWANYLFCLWKGGKRMSVLTIQGLSKSFGTQKIIDNLNMSVPEGSVFGFIGKNGAGKTTTMKMVLGLLQPNSGKICVCDEPVRFGQTKTNQYIGYLPDVPEFYNYMTPIQYLKLCGEVIGLSKSDILKRSQELLSLVGLNSITKPIGGFSRGMKQRLGIAQALLTQPKLLICDEPTSALDPVGRKEILDILYKISGTTTVLFSTHILSDVERICDHAAFLNEGKIAVSGTLAEIKALHGHDSLLLEFSTDRDLQDFKKQTPIEPLLLHSEENNRELILYSRNMENVQKCLFAVLAETGICPIKIELMEPSLESLFLEVVK
jgi:ABC-2 type transport system ATP-binding protein